MDPMEKKHDQPSQFPCTIHFQTHEWKIIEDWSIRNGTTLLQWIDAIFNRGLHPPKRSPALHTYN